MEHGGADGRLLTGTGLCWGSAPSAELLELAAAAARHGFPEIAVTPGQYLRPACRMRASGSGWPRWAFASGSSTR
jgi:hypothetical protein